MKRKRKKLFYLIPEASKILRVSDSLLYQAAAEGRITVTRLSGTGKRGKIIIPRAALKQFIRDNTTRPPDLPADETW